MPQIPSNLMLLDQDEDQVRAHNVRLVSVHQDLGGHLDICERAMDVIDMLRQQPHAGDDERAIVHLGLRVFNAFASAWKLVASGYYQVAALILRDIIETANLVSAFNVDPALVEKWRKADRRTLKRDFGPAAIRKLLDDHAGRGRSNRELDYQKFCTLAGHPCVSGFVMLRPSGGDARLGPFSDALVLRAILQEMGKLGVHAGHAFGVSLDMTCSAREQVAQRFLQGAAAY